MKRFFYLGVMLLSLLQLTTQSVNAMRVHAGSVTVTGGQQATVYVSSTWQSFMNQSNVSVKSTDWTTNNPNAITLRYNTRTYCDFYPDPFIANYSNVEIRFTIICTESGVYHEYELYWDVVTNGGGGGGGSNLRDGDTFWYSWNGVRMQFKVISASAKTCMVGAGSAESYDIAVSRTLSVASLTIPEVADGYRVTEVATCAFCRCDMIKKIIMPQSITKIGMNAFQGCKALTNITVPDAVTYIDDGAFSQCDNLEELTLGSSLEELGFQILWDSDKLTSLTSLSPVPPIVSFWGLGVESHATLFVPAGSVERYKNATGWSNFSKIEKIGGGQDDILVTGITINETSIVLKEGEIRHLTATVSPNNATDKSVTWLSDNTSVATVDNDGKVMAKAAGNAKITCMANDGSGVQATCDVNVKAVGIEINATNFPDENFRNYLLSQSYGKDGVLTDEEINGIGLLDVNGQNISNLKGIEFFTALKGIYCAKNNLTSLDFSKNLALKQVWAYDNKLTSIDVSKNIALTILSIYDNKLTTLDLSKNTALKELKCSVNQLSSLDVSNNTALTTLDCASNQLTSLDVSKNTALDRLICGYNQLTSLDISNNVALTALSCVSNQLLSLDLSNNKALEQLACSTNQLTVLDVSRNSALRWLVFYCNQIRGLAMDNLISSLPQNTTSNVYNFICIQPTSENEGNVCTKAQVAAVKAKGWFPGYRESEGYLEYEGSDPVMPEIISLPSTATVAEGQTLTLTPTVTPANAEYTLMWSSDDETVATVNQNGVVTGVKKGKTFINVETDNGKTAYCKLTVTAAEPIKIELPQKTTVYVGGSFTLTPTITPEGAETTLTWKSDDESVARVDANGVLTGVAEGLAIVTVSTSNGLTSNACKVTVEPDPSGITTVMMDEKAGVPIYTPSGQRLAAPRKGINIIGGKKVIVK